MDSLNPWTLPDPRTLNPPLRAGLDGWGILIEVRRGTQYRRYKYWAPDARHGPEADRARQLAAIVRSAEPGS
jgi:hypothetical protein